MTRDIKNVVIVDPAKTVKLHAADSAIVGVGIDRANSSIYFRDCVAGKMYPDEIYSEMFNMVGRLGAVVLAVETTSLHEFITQPIRSEIMRRRIYVRFVELKARDKKEFRIAQLAAYYRQGMIYHNKAVCQKLETQLLSFPRSQLWDVMDAFAYIIEVMDLEADLFHPPDEEVLRDEDYSSLKNDDDWPSISGDDDFIDTAVATYGGFSTKVRRR